MNNVVDYYNPFIGGYSIFHGMQQWGSAMQDGTLRLYPNPENLDTVEKYRCRSRRQAVRQLRRWMRGQGVTAVRVS